jgi:hypothetical protein
MKHVKILGLAAIAAMALMALVASSASATSLTSPAGKKLPANTVIESTLKPGSNAILEDTSGSTLDSCSGSTVSGKTSAESGTPLSGNIETLDWSGCTAEATTTLVNGALSIEGTGGGNGTLSGSGSRVTVKVFGVSCVYGTGTGTTLGTVTGGEPAAVDINAVINKLEGGFLCPSTTKWTANLVVTKPKPLIIDMP